MLADLILFTATANTSIVTLNLSLMLNKVGFYQVRRLQLCACRGIKLPCAVPSRALTRHVTRPMTAKLQH